MSALMELLENFEHLPHEFKRHLSLIREQEEMQDGIILFLSYSTEIANTVKAERVEQML